MTPSEDEGAADGGEDSGYSGGVGREGACPLSAYVPAPAPGSLRWGAGQRKMGVWPPWAGVGTREDTGRAAADTEAAAWEILCAVVEGVALWELERPGWGVGRASHGGLAQGQGRIREGLGVHFLSLKVLRN